jgi:hypothetical protein
VHVATIRNARGGRHPDPVRRDRHRGRRENGSIPPYGCCISSTNSSHITRQVWQDLSPVQPYFGNQILCDVYSGALLRHQMMVLYYLAQQSRCVLNAPLRAELLCWSVHLPLRLIDRDRARCRDRACQDHRGRDCARCRVARVGAACRQNWLIPESNLHLIGGLSRPTSGLSRTALTGEAGGRDRPSGRSRRQAPAQRRKATRSGG